MTKKQVEVVGAARYMENLYLNRTYPAMKKAENLVNCLKLSIKNTMPDVKRHLFARNKLVAKYVPVKKYETNQVLLNEYLADIGLLVPCARLDSTSIKKDNPELLERLKPYQLPPEYFVRMTPNKAGRVELHEVEFAGFTLDHLGVMWSKEKNMFDGYVQTVDYAKRQMEKCPILHEQKKLSCHFGSVSLLENKPKYDFKRIFEDLGIDFLIEHCHTDSSEIDLFIERGLVSPKEVNQFRKIVNNDLRFYVMEVESETKQIQYFHDKTIRAALNRRLIG